MEQEKRKPGRPKKTTPSVPLKPYTLLFDMEGMVTVEKAAGRSGQSKQEWCRETLLMEARKILTGKQEVAAPTDNINLIDIAKMIEESNKPFLIKLDELSQEVNKPLLKRLFRK